MLYSIYRMFQLIEKSVELPPFDMAGDNDRDAWACAFNTLYPTVMEGETINVPVCAEKTYKRFCEVRKDDPPWEALDAAARLKWEACVRHLVNILDIDPDDGDPSEVGTHEERMALWYEAKVREITEGAA
jgi:hypothetical protein